MRLGVMALRSAGLVTSRAHRAVDSLNADSLCIANMHLSTKAVFRQSSRNRSAVLSAIEGYLHISTGRSARATYR